MAGAAEDFIAQARLARRERRFDAARQHYERAIATLREARQPLRLAHTIRHLGDVCYEAGLAALAEPHLREALALYRRDGCAPRSTWRMPSQPGRPDRTCGQH